MDSYHPHSHHQQSWYPSSSPPPHPPPPGSGVGGGGYLHHLPAGYPPIPHHHQWPPPDPSLHHHSPQFPPPPPAGYVHSSAGPPWYPLPPPPLPPTHLQQQYQPSLPHPPPPMGHHQPPPPHLAYAPPTQAWGNPSWAQHQAWEYPERNIPYNNEEDWAARARAWAAAKSGTENHHTESHFAPIGRADEHSYAYHDQYQQAIDARTDIQHPSYPQSSGQHLAISTIDSQGQATNLRVGDEVLVTNRDPMASPQKRNVPTSSVYEQEVPYSYSSVPAGNRELVNQAVDSHVPSPMSSIQEGHHALPSLPVQMSSVDQPHFSHHGQSANFLPHVSDRPLDFKLRPSDNESREKVSYGHSGPRVMGVMDHDIHVPAISSWTTTAATGVAYPQIDPAGTQIDPSFLPQPPLPVHPAPVFGRMPTPSFQSSMPTVSAPSGLGNGSSLHNSVAFPGDANGLNLSERPKKAAVPNWLREEIIKKKAVAPSSVPMQPTGNSLDYVGPEDADKSLRRPDLADNKSIDSTRSTEDEDDDEEDVEAARSTAINQEIKRVLTEVLLKVTDELFDEIATKVLNEDKLNVEVEENDVLGKQNVSSPAVMSTPVASAKILVPVKMEEEKVNDVAEDSSTSSPGRDILGLGNYASDASDDDHDDEIRNPTLPSSGKKDGPTLLSESNDNSYRSEKNTTDLDGAKEKQSIMSYQENNKTEKGPMPTNYLKYDSKASEGASAVGEEAVLADRGKVNEFPSENGNPLQPKDTSKGKDSGAEISSSGHSNHDKSVNRDYWDKESKRNLGVNRSSLITEVKDNMHQARQEKSDTIDSVIHEDKNKLKERTEKGDTVKERAGDRNSERVPNIKESDSRRSSKLTGSKDDRKEIAKDKREKYKEDGERKRERGRDEEKDRSIRCSKSSSKHTSRRSRSPSVRGKNIKDSSFSHGSASGDEPSDNSRKRKQQSINSSLSPSPTKSRKREILRSPPSKHSHRRHSPNPSSEKRRRRSRSRSISPVHRRKSSAHKHNP